MATSSTRQPAAAGSEALKALYLKQRREAL